MWPQSDWHRIQSVIQCTCTFNVHWAWGLLLVVVLNAGYNVNLDKSFFYILSFLITTYNVYLVLEVFR